MLGRWQCVFLFTCAVSSPEIVLRQRPELSARWSQYWEGNSINKSLRLCIFLIAKGELSTEGGFFVHRAALNNRQMGEDNSSQLRLPSVQEA